MAFFNSLTFFYVKCSLLIQEALSTLELGLQWPQKKKNFFILFGGQLEKGLSQPVTSILRLIAVFK